MASSPCPPLDAHDSSSDHPFRLPPAAQFPDSPSVYSHACQSPGPGVLPETPSFSHPSDPAAFPDFDDEAASTIRSLSATDVQDDSDHDDCTDDVSHRMSIQGPRIRFHSRAPWETDDAISYPGQSDSNSRSTTVGSKFRGRASKADTFIRTLTRGPSITGRPSIDSARSQTSASSSFDMTAGNYSSSRGALYHLAKESVSTSSFSSSVTSASVRQQGFTRANNHPNFAQTHGSLSRATVSLDGMAPPSVAFDCASIPPSSYDTSRIVQEQSVGPSVGPSSLERPSRDKFVHPYANPDLVVPCTPSPETIPSHLISGEMNGSDSNSTFADSASIRSAAFSVISTQTSTSLTSRDLTHGHPRVNGKEISSPISVLRPDDTGYVDRNTKFLSLHPPPASFDVLRRDNPRTPAVALISLQEAQERERVRSNTMHAAVARPKPPLSSKDDVPEVTEYPPEEIDTVDVLARTRARSTSTGTRHATTSFPSIQPPISGMGEDSAVSRPTSAAPGRTLKHKKSGFMRLFTGRNSEEEKERSPPPPVPSLADAYTRQGLQVHGTGKASRSTLSKVPNSPFPPTLHASGASNVTLASNNTTSSDGDGVYEKGTFSRKRQPPLLSIVTKTPDHCISSVTAQSLSTGLVLTPPPPPSLTAPQSAPPGDTDFPGLKLRPVSASFSSHFTDMVVTTMDESRQHVHTPSSATSSITALSPFTPISMRRSNDASATAVEAQGEECSTIRGLRDQFTFAQKAWEQQIMELRGQIRDLTSELEDLRAAEYQEYCEVCGRGKPQGCHAPPLYEQQPKRVGVVNRPRARTGDTARFARGS